MQIAFIKRYVLSIGIAWTLVCAIALYSHLQEDYQQSVSQARVRADTLLERDILYRDWVASHGGVYVPVSSSTPPNPHLQFHPARDVETIDGRQLTLVNPSYMSSQAFAAANKSGDAISKLTSLKYLNEANAPDDWEKSALLKLEQGDEYVSAVVDFDGQAFVRIIRPFYVEPGCLDCHADQGYKLGDVRGGLSISVPFETFMTGHLQHKLLSVALFILLWLLGTAFVVLLGRKLYSQTTSAIESERQLDQAEMSLNFLSNYDRRTNLPNRFKFEEVLFELFHDIDTATTSIAVTTIEIRNYKQIIDNFDHPVGDALLKLLAERVATFLGLNDSVARFGEDRLLFSFTCANTMDFSEDFMPQLSAELAEPLVLEEHEFFPVVCMGTALYPQDASDAKRLVQRAVTALMFCLKNEQKGPVLFSQSLQDDARNRLEIEKGLRAALVANKLELYLQAQVDAAGVLIGAEALLRWRRDDGVFVSPAEFIPIAEESGLILPIGNWVMREAAAHAVTLHDRFGRIIPVGINVSARQFQDHGFVDVVDDILAMDGVVPEMLEVEITESTFIDDIGRTIEILTDLKVRGMQIAIDDFGTGYSSLSYLNRFPIDRLKIDRSFIADIATNEDDRVLVSLVAEMGRKLGMNVIAEGVEDDTQKNLLIGMGCDAIQGFLFGRPLPLDEFCAKFATRGASV